MGAGTGNAEKHAPPRAVGRGGAGNVATGLSFLTKSDNFECNYNRNA